MKSFEESEIWRKARDLCVEIFRTTSAPTFLNEKFLKDHLRRLSISIMSHLAESLEKENDGADVGISTIQTDCVHLRSSLYIALDIKTVLPEQFTKLNRTILELRDNLEQLKVFMKNRKHREIEELKETVREVLEDTLKRI